MDANYFQTQLVQVAGPLGEAFISKLNELASGGEVQGVLAGMDGDSAKVAIWLWTQSPFGVLMHWDPKLILSAEYLLCRCSENLKTETQNIHTSGD